MKVQISVFQTLHLLVSAAGRRVQNQDAPQAMAASVSWSVSEGVSEKTHQHCVIKQLFFQYSCRVGLLSASCTIFNNHTKMSWCS